VADDRLEDLRARLDDIAEELADLGRAQLRAAINDDDAGAAAAERRLSRARRSVLKAAALLGGQASPTDED